MKAAFLVREREIVFAETEEPIPKSNEVLVRVKVVGICGTDLGIYEGKRAAAKYPMIIGHEAAGLIVKVGSEVAGLEKGERVVIEPKLWCGECWFCRKGAYYQCDNGRTIGVNAGKGAFAEYLTVPDQNCHRLAQGISWEEAALIDTLACPFHAMNLPLSRQARTMAVLGSGAGGLCFVQLAKLRGVGKVILTGRHSVQLNLGKKLGADFAINVTQKDEVVQKVRKETDGRGVDLSVVACGSSQAVRDAVSMTRRQGRVMIYGVFGNPIELAVETIQRKELVVYGADGATAAYDAAVELISSGHIKVKCMISHRFKLEELDKAFKIVKERKEGYIKGVVVL